MADTEQVGLVAERLIAAVPQLEAHEQRIGLSLVRALAETTRFRSRGGGRGRCRGVGRSRSARALAGRVPR